MNRARHFAVAAASAVTTIALTTTALTATALGAVPLPGAAAAAAAGAVPVSRIQGADRIATAVAASRTAWHDAGSTSGPTATAAVISRADDYADALGGSALAGAVGGPLLLSRPAAIDAATLKEVTRLLGKRGTVYLLGGTGAISATAEKTLRDKGYTVKRLAGSDRFATSVEVAKQVARSQASGQPHFIFATTGQNFPDGLAAGATAAGYAASVVLTKDSVLPKVVKNYLDAERAAGVKLFAVGGATARASYRWSDSYVGKDRFETAALIARGFWGTPGSTRTGATRIALATGENWPDALAGGALIAFNGPLLLAQQAKLPAATKAATTALVKAATPSTVQAGYVLGGTGAVTDGVKTAFAAALNP